MSQAAPDTLRRLLDQQSFAVLCTSAEGWPYCSLVAFAAEPTLKTLYFATPRQTQKTANLAADARVALLIDNRSNQQDDYFSALALTVIGQARFLSQAELPTAKTLYARKHPRLSAFIEQADTAMVAVSVTRYRLVEQFQKVTDIAADGF